MFECMCVHTPCEARSPSLWISVVRKGSARWLWIGSSQQKLSQSA